MVKCPSFDYLVVMPHLRVQNANAISSPLTHGFPAMSAFLGLKWALQRQAHVSGLPVQFRAVGVVAHDYEEQITEGNFVNAFRLTRNPIDKDGKTAAIVEEGRIHLDVSLVFAVNCDEFRDPTYAQDMATQLAALVSGMRIAGGSVIPHSYSRKRSSPYVVPFTGVNEAREEMFDQLKMRFLPGFVLVERQDLLAQRHQQLLAENPQTSRLDAWLSLERINWHWLSEGENAEKGKWENDRQNLGWLVPIPLGYGALTDIQAAGTVANARDMTTDFRFVESLYGIGQWLSPHRLQSVEQLLWYANTDIDTGAYRCCNDYRRTQPTFEFELDLD